MERKNYYKYMFLSGAIWNIAVSLMCFSASIFLLDISSLFGMEKPPSLMWIQLFFGYVFAFGVGYYFVFKDISKNRGIIIVGIMEKLLTFLGILIYFILGDINLVALSLVSIDLFYGCLFIEFLINFKKI